MAPSSFGSAPLRPSLPLILLLTARKRRAHAFLSNAMRWARLLRKLCPPYGVGGE